MIYVIIQFICVSLLVFNINLDNFSLLEYFFILLALLLGGRALYVMEINNLNILPVLKKNHQLRTNDIYCLVRHPMYGSLLLLCFSLMLNNVNIFSLFVFMGLAINLFLKATYEEGKLLAKFSEYEDYQKKTSMFFPLKFFFKK